MIALSTQNPANKGSVAGGDPRDFAWPPKVDLFGVAVSPTTYDEAVAVILRAARRRIPGVVACHAVHALVTAAGDPVMRKRVNGFDMVTPDGQPVRWALNLLHDTTLKDRVYGPELMLRLCREAARAGISIYLYGGSPEVVERLRVNLLQKCPALEIAGYESPPYRSLTEAEDRAAVERINASGAGLVFVGLGCPKQDVFAYEHRETVRGVQLCVGAAFDFHSGAKPSAPAWMQRRGLEWLYRLIREPRRLWRRYLVTNTVFLLRLGLALCRARRLRRQRQRRRAPRKAHGCRPRRNRRASVLAADTIETFTCPGNPESPT